MENVHWQMHHPNESGIKDLFTDTYIIEQTWLYYIICGTLKNKLNNL